MRAVSTATVRPKEAENDGVRASGPAPGAMPAAERDGTRPDSRRVRPYQHRKGAPTARMAVASAPAISRNQEYAFIREDLRRLLVTAGILIVVMIGLLLVIDR